jgi:hypothetical protein
MKHPQAVLQRHGYRLISFRIVPIKADNWSRETVSLSPLAGLKSFYSHRPEQFNFLLYALIELDFQNG